MMGTLEQLELYVKTVDMYMNFKATFHEHLESRVDTPLTKAIRIHLKKIESLIDLQRKELNF